MTQRSLRLLIIAGTAALALAGCKTETAGLSKDARPIPAKTLELMTEKGMRKEDPILVRVYKEDSQLEVWKKRASDGRYAHLKTFEICRWSGALGPKKNEGDRQAPEGFYTVTPGQMNPKSAYYLSFDLGFPNAYDKSLGRSGKHLMVHGDCLSAGCYAMTDPQIAEVYALAREAFRGGQRGFQVQALPFRMTAENLARRRNDPNIAFWKNLKEGSDHFEVTKLEPKVDVCGKQYVFDAKAQGSGFDPNAQCPAYETEPSIAMAVAEKSKKDEQHFATLVSSGVQVAEAYVPQNGRVRRSLDEPIVPPAVMVAEAKPAPSPQSGSIALAMAGSSVPMPAPSPYASSQPKATPSGSSDGGMFAFLRGRPEEPAMRRTPAADVTGSTPAAQSTGNAALAMTSSRPVRVSAAPVTASLAPSAKKPFYKRIFSFGGDDQGIAPAPAPVARAAPQPVAVPRVAVPAPAAPRQAQAVAPQPAPKPVAAEPAPTASSGPELPSLDGYTMSGSQILSTGTFTQ